MKRLDDFVPRWEGRTLVLTLPARPPNRVGETLRVTPTTVEYQGSHPHHRFVDVLIHTEKRGKRYLPMLRFDGDAPIDMLCTAGPQRDELVRVLLAWVQRQHIRDAWGTPALEALLVPNLHKLARALEATPEPDGLVVPIRPATTAARVVGCLGVPISAASLVLALLLSAEAWDDGSTHLLYLQLWVFGSFFLFPGLLWLLSRLPKNPEGARLVLGQHGVTLRGERLPWHSIDAVVSEHGWVKLQRSEGSRTFRPQHGQASDLAALLAEHQLQPTPDDAPEALQRLRQRQPE